MLNESSGMISGSFSLDNGPLHEQRRDNQLPSLSVLNRYNDTDNIQEFKTPAKGPIRALNQTQTIFPSGQKDPDDGSLLRLNQTSDRKF